MGFKDLLRVFKKGPGVDDSSGVQDEKYRVGQVWSYKTRPQDRGSKLIIGKVEKLPRRPVRPGAPTEDEVVISIAVTGLSIKGEGEEVLEEISHLPIDRLAMEASVLELLDERQRPSAVFEQGYRDWRKVFDQGAAAYYKYPVAQCIELAERTFRSKQSPKGLS